MRTEEANAANFEGIDRLEPTRRPAGPVVMQQQWRELLFLHWPISEEQLRPLIPAQLSIDTFEGQAYIGLVPFTMRNVRPTYLPAFPPLSNFHEINVRTYVHCRGKQPGVWFFSLDAANSVAVRIARAWFKLPYFYAKMGLHLAAERRQYVTERLWPPPVPACAEIEWAPAGEARAAEPGTLEHFLLERYILYSGGNAQLYRGKVHHAPYPMQTATLHKLKENLIACAGLTRPTSAPLIHYAHGVDVSIYPLTKLQRISGDSRKCHR